MKGHQGQRGAEPELGSRWGPGYACLQPKQPRLGATVQCWLESWEVRTYSVFLSGSDRALCATPRRVVRHFSCLSSRLYFARTAGYRMTSAKVVGKLRELRNGRIWALCRLVGLFFDGILSGRRCQSAYVQTPNEGIACTGCNRSSTSPVNTTSYVSAGRPHCSTMTMRSTRSPASPVIVSANSSTIS